MTFLETPRFPDDISFGSQGGPEYNTSVIVLDSGYEQRNINWEVARHKYDVAYGVKTHDDLDSLIAHFHAVEGRAHGFRFKDYTDCKSSGSYLTTVTFTDQNFGTGDGIETQFQLKKTYVRGALSKIRNINKPVQGTILIGVNGVLKTETTDYTINYTTGLVTFTVAPPNTHAVTWGGDFDVPVRFDEDRLINQIQTYNIGSASVMLIEIRV